MGTVVFDQTINRHTLQLSGNDVMHHMQGEEYNSIIAVQVTGGGTLAVSVSGLPERPLRVVTTNDVFGCKAPNITFSLNMGSATVIIDRKRVRYDG